jgi:arabinofuranan 3-O-arabinosyltransferase
MADCPDKLPSPAGTLERNLPLICVGGFALLAFGSYGFAAYDLLGTLFRSYIDYSLLDRDFLNYWLGGRLVVSGEHLDLFDQSRYVGHLAELFGPNFQIRAWSYPPHYLLFVWPLGFLSYKTGFVAFIGGTSLLFAWAVAVFRHVLAPQADIRVLLLAVLGYALMMFTATQNGFFTAALLLLGLAWMRHRPVLAGLAFACLTIKPQLGLLIPVLLVFDRNWRAIFWAAVFTVVLIGLSTALLGVESWSAYFTQTLPYQRSVMTDWYGIFLRMMPTVFGSMRTLGFSPSAAAQAQLPVTLLALAAVLWLLCKERDALRRAFTVTCGTFLITPYAFNYDMGALCVCAALLAGKGEDVDPERRQFAVISIAAVAAISAAVTNLGRMNFPCTPLVLAVGLAALIVAARPVTQRRIETPTSVPSRS